MRVGRLGRLPQRASHLRIYALQATPQLPSMNGNHLVYSSPSGDTGNSGGALLRKDGEVVGMHVAGINSIQERLRHKTDFSERLNAVEASIDAAISRVSQGNLALLARAFPALSQQCKVFVLLASHTAPAYHNLIPTCWPTQNFSPFSRQYRPGREQARLSWQNQVKGLTLGSMNGLYESSKHMGT